MNDWLSERLEKHDTIIGFIKTGMPPQNLSGYVPELIRDSERMARVIRELVTIASKAQEVVSYTRVSDPEDINKLSYALNNLSSDVKDLLPI